MKWSHHYWGYHAPPELQERLEQSCDENAFVFHERCSAIAEKLSARDDDAAAVRSGQVSIYTVRSLLVEFDRNTKK